MAIQTGGFGVRVMPQFTASDPSLVAFNPTAFTDGLGQAFKLAQTYENLKASKALQAELDATRRKRIDAQNMGFDVDIARGGKALRQMPTIENVEDLGFQAKAKTIMPEADFRLLQLNEQSRSMPVLTDAAMSNAQFGMDKNAQMRPHLPTLVGAEVADARARTAEANSATNLAGMKESAAKAKLGLDQKIAELTAANAEPEALLRATRVSQQLANARTDEDMRKALEQAKLELTQSQTEENRAQADYARGLGRQAGAQKTPEQELREVQLLIDQLDGMAVGDGTLGSYIADTRNKEGKLKGDAWMGLQPNPTLNPQAEAYVKTKEIYTKRLKELLAKINGGQPVDFEGGANAPVAKTEVSPQKALPANRIPAGHRNFLLENRHRPEVIADFERMYGEGSAASILR